MTTSCKSFPCEEVERFLTGNVLEKQKLKCELQELLMLCRAEGGLKNLKKSYPEDFRQLGKFIEYFVWTTDDTVDRSTSVHFLDIDKKYLEVLEEEED